MKRLIAFSIVFTLLAAGVFAEFKVTGGAGMSFIPVGAIMFPDTDPYTKDRGTELAAGFGRNGGVSTQMELNFQGDAENGKAGFLFQWRPRFSGDGLQQFAIGDNAGLWVKPLDWIRIDAGRFVNNDIRGRMGAGAWFGDYTAPRPGEGEIFSNFDGKAAAMVSLKPTQVEGLGVYVLVNNMVDTYTNYQPYGANKGIAYVYENTQAAVSYAIPNIGLARLQYVGAHPAIRVIDFVNPDTWPDDQYLPSGLANITGPQIQFAFAYTGVPNLTVDLGAKYPLPVSDPKTPEHTVGPGQRDPVTGLLLPETDIALGLDNGTETKGKFQAPIAVTLGVKYVAGNLTATLIADGKFAGSYDRDEYTTEVNNQPVTLDPEPVKLGIEVRPWLTVQYKINDTFTAQVEGGIVYAGESKADDIVVASGAVRYGFGAGVQTTFAPSCTLRSGITYAGGERIGIRSGLDDPEAVKLNGVFSVPLIFGVSF